MIAAITLAAHLTAHRCVIESRDHAATSAGAVAYFEVRDTCMLHGLFVVADSGDERTVLTGVNRHTGRDLTVTIRIPRNTKPGTVFYPYGWTPANDLYRAPTVDFRPITITR